MLDAKTLIQTSEQGRQQNQRLWRELNNDQTGLKQGSEEGGEQWARTVLTEKRDGNPEHGAGE